MGCGSLFERSAWFETFARCGRGIEAGFDQRLSFQESIRLIESEEKCGRFADVGQSDDIVVIDTEVFGPVVRSGVEQSTERLGSRRNCGDIAAFETVAEDTGKCKVVRGCFAAVLFADDVFDLASEERIALVYEAVFAEIFCAVCDKTSEGRRDVATH